MADFLTPLLRRSTPCFHDGHPRPKEDWAPSDAVTLPMLKKSPPHTPRPRRMFVPNCVVPMPVRWYSVATFCFYGLPPEAFELLRPIVGDCNFPYWPGADSSGDYFNGPEETGPVEAGAPNIHRKRDRF